MLMVSTSAALLVVTICGAASAYRIIRYIKSIDRRLEKLEARETRWW